MTSSLFGNFWRDTQTHNLFTSKLEQMIGLEVPGRAGQQSSASPIPDVTPTVSDLSADRRSDGGGGDEPQQGLTQHQRAILV